MHAVQRFLHQAKLPVIQTVQSQRDEFVVRELRLIFFRHAAHFGHGIELGAQAGNDLLPFFEQHPAIVSVLFIALRLPRRTCVISDSKHFKLVKKS